jgi:1,4-dihydroxy-2-naphthoate octaprenyltransferase
MDNENKPKRIAPVVAGLAPIIWQSFIEAIVFFFTTVGLEAWWNRKKDK